MVGSLFLSISYFCRLSVIPSLPLNHWSNTLLLKLPVLWENKHCHGGIAPWWIHPDPHWHQPKPRSSPHAAILHKPAGVPKPKVGYFAASQLQASPLVPLLACSVSSANNLPLLNSIKRPFKGGCWEGSQYQWCHWPGGVGAVCHLTAGRDDCAIIWHHSKRQFY